MKYFTSELWSKYTGASIDELPKVELEWDEAVNKYSVSFELIKDRLSKKFLRIYNANSGFHDFHIKEFQMIHKDYLQKSHKNPISFNLIIANGINTWKITYKNVKNLSINYKEEIMCKDTVWERTNGFDDWGYDEFSAINEDTLSHEILFASEATIRIYFKNNNIFISKV